MCVALLFIHFRLVVSYVQPFPPSTQPECRLRLGAPEPHPAYYALDCPGPCLVPGDLTVYAGLMTAKAQHDVYLLNSCLLLLVLDCGALEGLRYGTPPISLGFFGMAPMLCMPTFWDGPWNSWCLGVERPCMLEAVYYT